MAHGYSSVLRDRGAEYNEGLCDSKDTTAYGSPSREQDELADVLAGFNFSRTRSKTWSNPGSSYDAVTEALNILHRNESKKDFFQTLHPQTAPTAIEVDRGGGRRSFRAVLGKNHDLVDSGCPPEEEASPPSMTIGTVPANLGYRGRSDSFRRIQESENIRPELNLKDYTGSPIVPRQYSDAAIYSAGPLTSTPIYQRMATSPLPAYISGNSLLDGSISSLFPSHWNNGSLSLVGDPLEQQARAHRASAAQSEPRCTWSGQLPVRTHKNPIYSPKVFLGGVPWDISDSGLMEAFAPYGSVKVQWPSKETRSTSSTSGTKSGYLYVIFDHDKNVKALLQACTHDFSDGGKYYFNISTRKMRCKEVQVIPWVISDSNFVKNPSQRIDSQKTVFVGALHGMLTADGLFHVMNDLFGGVAYVGIDTDKYKYPIGSGRVTFNNSRSYMKAVQAAFIDIRCPRFTKKV